MKDKFSLKKEKVADLLFDLVKYLLTTLGALILLSEKPVNLKMVAVILVLSLAVFIVAVFITPLKED